jgi:molybdopterin synthase catalytic subunit
MNVRVRLFAVLRERAGTDAIELELPDHARVSDALDRVKSLTDGVPVVMAVNQDYASADDVLHQGDEVALIPPVSGGDDTVRRVRVTDEPLDVAALSAAVRDPHAGAVVVFEGVTREVERLEYEAYAEMAEPKLRAICAEEAERHGLCAVAVEHRIGTVPLSEPSVLVAASGPHRGETFAGARAVIDRVKAEAPIWKKEIEGGDERWVEGTLPA